VLSARPFTIDAIAVLPDHLHCIWTLPPEDADYSTRWRLIKTWFSKHYAPATQSPWQRRYWEHLLRDESDFTRHVDYIHYNPVKHGHAATAMEWPYSSFRRHVEAGIYAADWGRGSMSFDGIGRE
jgi:putative transposase